MINIGKKVFDNIIKVKPVNIIMGFDNFNSAIISDYSGSKEKDTEAKFYNLLNKLYEEEEELIVDYYGNELSNEEFTNMINNLNEEEAEFLNRIKEDKNNSSVYFKIENVEELNLLLNLSLRSILFTTFYFSKDNLTIWSNYDYKFVIFFNEESNLEKYKMLVEECDLVLKDINIV